MNLAESYLLDRGISLETAKFYGVEIDDQLYANKIKDRLGRGLPKSANEILWFSIFDALGNIISWIARPLPNVSGLPKFLCPVGATGVPFVPKAVYGLAHGRPINITEGPVKALACVQAGIDAIGINGVWGASTKNNRDNVVIRSDLQTVLDWRGRKVYLAFDADSSINPDVRHALFRLFFILSVSGAEVFQLTTWDIGQGKGIDDNLVTQFQANGQCKPEDALKGLLASAKPFMETIEATALDLSLVCSELAKVEILPALRDQLCKPLAQRLGVPVNDLRKIGGSAQKSSDFVDPDPWPSPVDGAALMGELVALYDKHIITEDHCKIAHALWDILTYLIDVVDIMPILAITSPTKRCGKSRCLELHAKLACRPLAAILFSAATIYRGIEKWHPTLLIDEADGILKDQHGNDNLALRSVINAGHTRASARVPRCVGDSHDVQLFSVWAARAIALIGRMPDSMMDRAIEAALRRKTKNEQVARIRDTSEKVFEELRSKIVRFVQDNGTAISQLVPAFPMGLDDRAEDCWFPMLAIAEVIGGNWPELTRKAALALSGARNDDDDTFSAKLLRALQEDFLNENQNGATGFEGSEDICTHLNEDKEAPWAGSKFRKGMTPELLAKNLARYKVKSERITLGGQKVRGFHWKHLKPIFDRYL
jgi:hypothetical protein